MNGIPRTRRRPGAHAGPARHRRQPPPPGPTATWAGGRHGCGLVRGGRRAVVLANRRHPVRSLGGRAGTLAAGRPRRPTAPRWHWSAAATAVELIPCQRARPSAAYLRVGHGLLDSLTCVAATHPPVPRLAGITPRQPPGDQAEPRTAVPGGRLPDLLRSQSLRSSDEPHPPSIGSPGQPPGRPVPTTTAPRRYTMAAPRLRPHTVQLCIHCRQTPAGFWVSRNGGMPARRP
jgi:hypothetical protein